MDTISIPLIPNFCNVAVFPLNGGETKSPVYILKKSAAVPEASGFVFHLQFLPNHVYCLLPSSEVSTFNVTLHKSRPGFLENYSYCLQIDPKTVSVTSKISSMDNSPATDPDSIAIQRPSCKSCFISHFPKPNTKFCKGIKKFKPGILCSAKRLCVRLRGGAKEEDNDSLKNMKDRAVFNARLHDLSILSAKQP